jgi:hypothetical protein
MDCGPVLPMLTKREQIQLASLFLFTRAQANAPIVASDIFGEYPLSCQMLTLMPQVRQSQ